MRIFRLCLVCLFVVSVSGQPPSRDITALLEFKKVIRLDPTDSVLDSWNDDSNTDSVNGCPQSWKGITCVGNHVASIVLDNLGLSADVDLSPLSNLKMLVNLSLAGNNFSGSIPDSISELSSVRSLDMSRNSLSGPLPQSLTRLRNLVYLNLSLNGLIGSIPKGFELMTQLDVLDLHGNMLGGKFDPEFLLLTNASHVDLSGNLLVSFANEQQRFLFGISQSLKHLNLSHNQITGSLIGNGESTQAFGSLKVLDLSYNQLSGELPGFDFVYDLQILNLGNNRFSGSIPNNLLKGDSLGLTELDLSSNNFSGPISTITSTTLRTLNLSSNALSGELPPLTGSCAVLDLSRNQLEGNLTRLLKWGNIEVLDLSKNQLTGSIPEVTAQFLRLHYLNLSHNSLNGSIPQVITRFPKLTTLDLSVNSLDGPLLTPLLTLSTLKELHLQSNKLSGSIDLSSSSGNLNLQVLDFSNNQLAGFLPDEIGLFTGLLVLNIGGNNFSGSVPNSVTNISSLTSLDISRNHFTGPLPTNLSDNLQSFNVSYNDLFGVVPENLRKFPLSSFYPGNSALQFPNPPPGSYNVSYRNGSKKHLITIIIFVTIATCVVTVIILILLAIFLHYKHKSRTALPHITIKDPTNQSSPNPPTSVPPLDHATSRKPSTSEIISPDEKTRAITNFSPSKTSHLSWSPSSGDSYTAETNIPRLDIKSPDQLAGELYFLDDTISFTSEELSRAPAEVLGRSSHGTSYRATLDNGISLTVKWLREGVAKQRKEFAKEAKKFANIRHPNVVGLRGYYWGPTQHEKLILSDYISPGNLANFLYDRPGRKVPPLTWGQRLKIAVDIARGLNYLHFDRAMPHGNLKASNVLLDGPDLNARVADYCLHRLMTQSGTVEQILDAGVLGYRAPELAASRRPVPSFKSDVYAFGVILLELVTGKCASDVVDGEELTDWVQLRVAEGRQSECFDAVLAPEMSVPATERGSKEVFGMALRCIRSVSDRPGIKTVYEDLSSI